MIVRISGEDQYRLDDERRERLNELDNAVVEAAEAGNSETFTAVFAELLDYVREHGEVVDDDELEPSSLILPPPDISVQEAAAEFTGEGLIPD